MLSPAALVEAAAAAGLRTIAVTDHDTVDGLVEARAAALHLGLTFVDGIEVTAIEHGRDVHVLGYFFDPSSEGLKAFLAAQRADRLRRVRGMLERLAAVGAPVDAEPILRRATVDGRSVGRPHVAEALIAAGHVRSFSEAFDRYLARGCAAYVARAGASAADVVRRVADAGGICSFAHPATTKMDELLSALATAGLAAVEVRHPDHDAETEARYRALAKEHGLAMSGGSDFHARPSDDPSRGRRGLGSIDLPRADFEGLLARRP